jgi:hypothetical protein
MKVESYNKGRTNKDVSDKTWIDGTRLHLRPDTMYPDERYASITQSEINEATARVKARDEAKSHHKGHHDHGHQHAHPPHD